MRRNGSANARENRHVSHPQRSYDAAAVAGWHNARQLTQAVTGPLHEAAAGFAVAEEGPADFTHRLLLRALVFAGPDESPLPNDIVDARAAYLERRTKWQSGTHHPWEMISLYRAILCATTLWRGIQSTGVSKGHSNAAAPALPCNWCAP